jgi:hypothetical protein
MLKGRCRVREFRCIDVATVFRLDFPLNGIFVFERRADSDFAEVEISGKKYPILAHWLEIELGEGKWAALVENPCIEAAIGDFSYPLGYEQPKE